MLTDEEIKANIERLYPEDAKDPKYIEQAISLFKHMKNAEKKEGPINPAKMLDAILQQLPLEKQVEVLTSIVKSFWRKDN